MMQISSDSNFPKDTPPQATSELNDSAAGSSVRMVEARSRLLNWLSLDFSEEALRPTLYLMLACALVVTTFLHTEAVFAQSDSSTIAGEPLSVSLAGESLKLQLHSVTTSIDDPNSQHFKGQVSGDDSSWVRVSRINGQWKGVVSRRGNSYFIDHQVAIDSNGQAAKSGSFVAQGNSANLKLLAIESVAHDKFCPLDHGEMWRATTQGTASKQQSNLLTIPVPAQKTYAELCDERVDGVCILSEMEFAFDLQFQQRYGNSAASEAQALINIVEGFYENDFGIRFDNLTVELLGSELFSTTTSASTLLNDVADKKGADQIPFLKNQRALFHLITGRDFDGGTAGIAFLDVLCNGFGSGAGVSQLLPNSGQPNTAFSAVIVAHELGHNFGSDHDGDGNTCSSGFIMNPSVSAGAPGFSTCSIDTIQQDISQLSNQDLCFNYPVDANITADGANVSQVVLGESFTNNYQITGRVASEPITDLAVSGSLPAGSGTLQSVALGANNCTLSNSDTAYNCSLDTLGGGATLVVSALPSSDDFALSVIVDVSANSELVDINTANNRIDVDFGVAPAKPTAPGTLAAAVGGGVSVDLTWADNSNNETGFRVERRSPGGTFASVAQLGQGVTSFNDSTTQADTDYEYQVIALNQSTESDPSNTVAITTAAAPAPAPTPPPPTSGGGGGGGGSVPLLWLAVLLVIGLCRTNMPRAGRGK